MDAAARGATDGERRRSCEFGPRAAETCTPRQNKATANARMVRLTPALCLVISSSPVWALFVPGSAGSFLSVDVLASALLVVCLAGKTWGQVQKRNTAVTQGLGQ